jgi:NAD(P)-dependent dehydrogenase (short-subunit alcohol dehydrogenase family)
MTSMDDRGTRLAGAVTLITGAGSGIGRATAMLFARQGAQVACVDIVHESAQQTVAMIGEEAGRAISIQADVRSAADAQRMVQTTVKELGRLDVLMNNAGTAVRSRLHELDEDGWHLDLQTNLTGVYQCCKAAIPVFLEQGKGNIVNVASTLGILAFPGFPAFAAAKAGVIMLTRQLALEYGPNIRVNCVCPGATDTPTIRAVINAAADPAQAEIEVASINRVMQRLARPIEIANGALFLASEESSFMTGQSLIIDGGQTIDA